MLGGHVGLLADLGLMSQVAALARDVCHTFLSLKAETNSNVAKQNLFGG
jgi:hypothetical protein